MRSSAASAERLWLGAALALGLAMGLVGLSAGLPGAARLRALPGGKRLAPEAARSLADAWSKLYQQIEQAHARLRSEEPVTYATTRLVVPAGWTSPPAPLVNSTRAFLLQADHPDEKKSFIVLSRMRPWRLEFQPLYVQYGGAFVYPLGAALAAAHAAGVARLTRDIAHYLQYPEDMGRLYLIGRLYVLLFSLASLAVLFVIGNRLNGPVAGFLSAVLYALAPVVVENSHLVKPHAVASFWALLSALFLLQSFRSGKLRDYLLCGAFAGAASGAALTLAFALGWPALAALLRGKNTDLRRAAAACALAAAVCAALNPYLLFSFGKFAWELEVYGGGAPPPLSGSFGAFAASAAEGLGAALALVLAASTLWALRRGGERRLLALAALLGAVLLFAKFRANAFRLYLPLVGLACALAADALSRARWAPAVLLAVALDSGLRSGVLLVNLARADTSVRAADWLEESRPAGSALGLVRLPEPAHTPPFELSRFELVVLPRPDDWKAPDAPEYAVVDAAGLSLLESWGISQYIPAAQFEPARALWARRDDDPTYANTGFFVLRRAAASTSHE